MESTLQKMWDKLEWSTQEQDIEALVDQGGLARYLNGANTALVPQFDLVDDVAVRAGEACALEFATQIPFSNLSVGDGEPWHGWVVDWRCAAQLRVPHCALFPMLWRLVGDWRSRSSRPTHPICRDILESQYLERIEWLATRSWFIRKLEVYPPEDPREEEAPLESVESLRKRAMIVAPPPSTEIGFDEFFDRLVSRSDQMNALNPYYGFLYKEFLKIVELNSDDYDDEEMIEFMTKILTQIENFFIAPSINKLYEILQTDDIMLYEFKFDMRATKSFFLESEILSSVPDYRLDVDHIELNFGDRLIPIENLNQIFTKLFNHFNISNLRIKSLILDNTNSNIIWPFNKDDYLASLIFERCVFHNDSMINILKVLNDADTYIDVDFGKAYVSREFFTFIETNSFKNITKIRIYSPYDSGYDRWDELFEKFINDPNLFLFLKFDGNITKNWGELFTRLSKNTDFKILFHTQFKLINIFKSTSIIGTARADELWRNFQKHIFDFNLMVNSLTKYFFINEIYQEVLRSDPKYQLPQSKSVYNWDNTLFEMKKLIDYILVSNRIRRIYPDIKERIDTFIQEMHMLRIVDGFATPLGRMSFLTIDNIINTFKHVLKIDVDHPGESNRPLDEFERLRLLVV